MTPRRSLDNSGEKSCFTIFNFSGDHSVMLENGFKKISWLMVKKLFFTKKSACGNVPEPKTSFSTKKSACGNVPGPKTRFSTKKRRLRQRTRTKNVFFSTKKAPAATYQDQKRIFSQKKGACGNVPAPANG